MASPHVYTSMPWSMRSDAADMELLPVSTNYRLDVAQNSHNEVLIRQLTDARAEHRKYDVRIAELDRHIEGMQHTMGERIKSLEDELSQCHKRDGAAQELGIMLYRRGWELVLKIKELEERERKAEKEEARTSHLLKDLETERGRFEIEHIASGNALSTACASVQHNGNEEKNIPRLAMWTTEEVKDAFKITDSARFNERNMTISFEAANKKPIQLLRHHDYYKGWMDGTKAAGQEQAVSAGYIDAGSVPHLYDAKQTMCLERAGINAGCMFTWSALCQKHKPEWETRLDERKFYLDSLLVPRLQKDMLFWVGYARGQRYVQQRLWERVNREDGVAGV